MFWELENIKRESESFKNKEAGICEEHFLKNCSRTETGQYMVKIPFKEDLSCFGESKKKTVKIRNSLWKNSLRKWISFSYVCIIEGHHISMDNILTGTDDLDTDEEIQQQLISLLNGRNME